MAEFTKEAMIAAIYGQESSSGAADTSKANYAGAIGPMQVIRPTFDALKNKGLIPNNFEFTNPEHSKAAGDALVSYLYTKYDGDPKKVSAAYYAGEKAVRADGTIANFKDRKNASAPSTHDYVNGIMARLTGESSNLGEAPAASPVGPATVLSSWDEGYSERKPKPAKTVADNPKVMQASDVAQLTPHQTEADRLAGVEAGERATQQASDDTTFLEQSKKAFIQSTFGGAYIRKRAMDQYLEGQQPLQGWKVPDEALVGMSSDEQDFMREAVNPQHAERIKMEIDDRRADLATVNTKGTGVGIAATMFAGLPEGYLLGFGAARGLSIMGAGSATLAAEGRLGASLVSSVAENVGANVALTGLQDSFDPYVGTADYGMAVAGGLLGVALTSPGLFHANASHAVRAELAHINSEAATRTVELRQQAVKNLGEDATPEALQAEVRRLETNQIQQTLSAARGEIPAERRLLPEEDALRADTEIKPSSESSVAGTEKAPISSLTRPGDSPTEWSAMSSAVDEARKSRMSGDWAKQVAEVEGVNQRWVDKQAAGTHILPALLEHERYAPVTEAIAELQKKFLPKSKVVVGISKLENGGNPVHEGVVYSAGDSHIIGIRGNLGTNDALTTSIHELGHAVFHENARAIPPQLLSRMIDEHRAFLADLRSGNGEAARLKRFAEGSASAIKDGAVKGELPDLPYVTNFDEYTAEAFTRYIQRRVRSGELSLPEKAVQLMAAAWERVKQLYDYARGKGWLGKDEAFDEFFDRVAAGNLKEAEQATEEFLSPGLMIPGSFSKQAEDIVNDPVAIKNGLSLLPVGTDTQKAEAAAVTALYKKATDLNIKVDEKRLSKLMDTAVFKGGQSVTNTMLRSKNPVVRMVASELLEATSGAAGRRSNAAIAKYMNEHAYLGNTLNEVQESYKQFRNASGQTVAEDFFGGKTWDQFNRMVAEEIESRQTGKASVNSPASVVQAADNLEKAYERMRVAQTQTKTIGWGALPETSKGYMPHKMSPEKVRNMSAAQADALHSALRDQFIGIDGFDITFSENLARKYIDRVQRRALGGFDAPIGVHQVGAADIVEDALTAMGLSKPEVKQMMSRYMKGAANHTKKRLKLDLSAEYAMEDGSSFKLMDLFETDQFRLLRTQASRVSGEVALARHGVMGKAGLNLLRRAMEFGADGEKATANELEAFDQVAAEFLGDKFGTQSQALDRIMQVNSLARLGGMGFTQFAESINGIFHVGAIRTLDAITSMGRLRSEIKALARGEKVDNGILSSIEDFGGADFGTESYKTVFPFDNGSLQYQTYGKDTVTAADRLLRGGQYLQGKLSLWKTIHSTQQRGFAEQIVRKAAGFIKNGGNDAALKDMGISDELISRLRKDIDSIAQFNGSKLTNFDITKATDVAAAEEFTQAIHRGVSQIIQGTFIGERSKWAHDPVMRIATQFRTFSLTSVEKQWARQVGNVGTAKTLGMMLGAMSIAAPIYMARVHLASIGRSDREEYLEKQLTPAQIGRATLNYIAMSGLAGDFLDAGTAVTGIGKVTGGRSGNQSEFIGNMVAPSLGLLDDAWKAVQNTKDGTDPHELLKTLPFNRHPLLIPAINALGN